MPPFAREPPVPRPSSRRWTASALGAARLGALLFSATTALAREKLPADVIVVPEVLSARVLHHVVTTPAGKYPCWTYVSKGLAAHGQKELALTVLRRPAEAPDQFPQEPLFLFKLILERARAGQIVDEGGRSELGRAGFLGRTDLRGLLYVRAVDFGKFQIPEPTLAVVGLVGDEVRLSEEQGALRVLGRLASQYRFYPCPPWIDRDRAPVVTEADRERSLLAQLPRVRLPGLRVVLSGDRVTLRLRQSARDHILEAFSSVPPEKSVLAFLAELDPVANALAIWRPGQRDREAVSPEGSDASRLAGAFIALGRAVGEWRVQPLEDGFVALLPPEQWTAFHHALETGTAYSVDGAPSVRYSFALEWIADSYENPVDGRSYRGDWETYAPAGSAAASTGPVALDHIVLLTSEQEMRAAGVDPTALAAYTKQIVNAVERHFAQPRQRGRDLVVQCDFLGGGRSVVVVGVKPKEGAPDLTDLRDELGKMAAPPFAVKFQMYFKLWGGDPAAR